jgi:hypothetical protein
MKCFFGFFWGVPFFEIFIFKSKGSGVTIVGGAERLDEGEQSDWMRESGATG